MRMTQKRTFFEKAWSQNVILSLNSGFDLLHVDRNFIHDLSGAQALAALTKRNQKVRYPGLTFACPDHTVSTNPETQHGGVKYEKCVRPLREYSERHGITYFNYDNENFGIIHVIGPELGLSLPGLLIVCGDSHTCTHGGLGALAWGIGASEVEHVLATGTVVQKKPKALRVNIEGNLPKGVVAKDVVLKIIGSQGSDFGVGYAVEFDGDAIRAMSVENRMTICNMSIELGAKFGMISPDEKTIQYIKGREFAPKGNLWKIAKRNWAELRTDQGARFDKQLNLDTNFLQPQISWGINPEHTVGVGDRVPDPCEEKDLEKREFLESAVKYSRLKPGTPLEGIPINRVFIGSCTNSRLEDLVQAADLAKGRKVASDVQAWVVPGSRRVKNGAEALGIDQIFREAGFQWREPGCSMCVGSNGEIVEAGNRCVSTSNRNFVGRQGPGSHTHLASPLTAVASAIAGKIADPRKFIG